jgi:hypothetical protein
MVHQLVMSHVGHMHFSITVDAFAGVLPADKYY